MTETDDFGQSRESILLSRRQIRAIPILVAARTLEEGYAEAGIGGATARTWMKEPVFIQSLREAQAESFREALRNVQTSSSQAVRTLQNLLGSESELVRLRAATTLLDLAMRSRETLDLEERFAALEAQMKEVARG